MNVGEGRKEIQGSKPPELEGGGGVPESESGKSGLRLFDQAGVQNLGRRRSRGLWLRADFCGLTSNFDFSDPNGLEGGAGGNPVDPHSRSRGCVVDSRFRSKARFVSAPCWTPLVGR